jgi:hypothetical protein
MTDRRGLSLTEFLTLGVLAIFAGALAAPSALRAREAARRSQCQTNLNTIGKAVYSYAGTHNGALPSGQINGTVGWITSLLPYLGEGNLYNSYRAGEAYDHPDNAGTVATRLPVLECPDVKREDRLIAIGEDKSRKAAPTDYIGLGITLAVRQLFPPDFDFSGALLTIQQPTTARLDSIPDGLSYTGFVFESADKNNVWQAGKLVKQGQGQPGTWSAYAVNAFRGYSFDGVQVPGPCAVNCNNQTQPYGFHAEGANVFMGDGAVRCFHPKMDVWVMYGLISRNGGEVLTESDF